MEDFLAKFHSLTGITIGERCKNLFYLLNETKESNTDLDFALIQPKTYLEEIFKVETLIFFERTDELIQVLKSENPRLINKVLNAPKSLILNIFSAIDPTYLVDEMFLEMSFRTKEKIVAKLALHLDDEEKGDRIFFAVKDRYGMYLATKLLPCCSKEVILNASNSKIELRQSQLLLIVRRHPDLLDPILRKLERNFTVSQLNEKYKEVFRLVAQTDQDKFLVFAKEKRVVKRLGRRLTKKLVTGSKEGVIESALEIEQVVHAQQLAKSLSGDYGEFYLNIFPSTLVEFERNYNSYLDKLEKLPGRINKFKMFVESFQRKYGEPLLDFRRFASPRLLEAMPLEERVAWVKNRPKPTGFSDEVWICLKGLDESVPELQARIGSAAKVDERAQLVGALVETCRINGKNKDILLEVSKYVLKHHNNTTVFRCFMQAVKKCFDERKFGGEQWKCCKKMLDKIRGKKDEYHYVTMEWVTSYLFFCLSQNEPIEDMVKKLYEQNHGCSPSAYKTWSKSDMVLCEQFFRTLNEIVWKLYEGEELQTHYSCLINNISCWNQRQPHKIDVTSIPNMSKFLENCYSSQTTCPYISEQIIMAFAKSSNPDHAKLLDLYLSRTITGYSVTDYDWFLKHKPEVVSKHIVHLTKQILSLYYTQISTEFWKFSNNYHHLGIPQKIVEVCLEQFLQSDEADKQQNAAFALACVASTREYLDLIAPYYPTEAAMELTQPDQFDKYQLQQSITKSLKNIVPPSAALDSVLKFTQGDYLKHVQRSLYSLAHNVVEANLPLLVDELASRAVSVRKHAIYLTLKVLNKTKVYQLIASQLETERNPSILKFLFKGTFRLFIQNPDDYLWDMLQKYSHKLHREDKECYEFLLEVEKVPQTYRAAYVMFVWKILPEFVKDEELETGQLRLLRSISKHNISQLAPEFLKEVVDGKFFKASSGDQATHDEAVFDFVCKFIIFASNEVEQNHRLGYILKVLKSLPEGELKTKERFSPFLDFVKKFCSHFRSEDEPSEHVLGKFVEMWKTAWTPHEFFAEYLHLELTLVWRRAQPGRSVARLCTSLVASYGLGVLQLFCSYLKGFVLGFRGNFDFFPLIDEILTENKESSCLFLAISLLPEEFAFLAPHRALYGQILDELEQNSNPIVQLALHAYFERVNKLLDDKPIDEKPKPYFGGYCLPNRYEMDIEGL